VLEFAAALIPSIGVGLLFWFVVRAIISADRRERAAVAQFEREERAEKQGEN
jgi:hypothetical protein